MFMGWNVHPVQYLTCAEKLPLRRCFVGEWFKVSVWNWKMFEWCVISAPLEHWGFFTVCFKLLTSNSALELGTSARQAQGFLQSSRVAPLKLVFCVCNCAAANYKVVIVCNLIYPSDFLLEGRARLHLPEATGGNVPWLMEAGRLSQSMTLGRAISELGPNASCSDSPKRE